MKGSNSQLQHEGFSNAEEGRMRHLIVRLATAVALMTLLIFASQPTNAADYPAKGKVITQIVHSGIGGSLDLTARFMQPLLEKELGVSMPVVNRVGGAGAVGMLEVIKSKPDGYTIGWIVSSSSIGAYMDLERKPSFSRKDFKLVSCVVLEPAALVVRPDSPYKTLKDLVTAAKANPGKITASASNIMSSGRLAGLALELATGIQLSYVLYDEGGKQRAALLGGHVDLEFNTASEVSPTVTSGQVRSLAVFDNQRSSFLPNNPTAVEQGYNASFSSVRGIMVSAATPDSIVNTLDAAVRKALANPENAKDLKQKMMAVRYMGPKEFDAQWTLSEKQIVKALEDIKKVLIVK
jgi:tripartite-type tricarboxylate transporter receptor subunit TctC